MSQSKQKQAAIIITYVCLVLGGFALILILPQSREVFKSLSASHPFIMGFIKFSLLATAGEFLAIRLAKGAFSFPKKTVARLVIWGLIGVWITFMMKAFGFAAADFMQNGILPKANGEFLNRLLKAFYTSVLMNTTFGPTFMALHKCSDQWLELKADGKPHRVTDVVSAVNWSGFATFTLGKTVPLFWIPAHTVTFLLPAEYQVIMAAALSVALGIILNLGGAKNSKGKK